MNSDFPCGNTPALPTQALDWFVSAFSRHFYGPLREAPTPKAGRKGYSADYVIMDEIVGLEFCSFCKLRGLSFEAAEYYFQEAPEMPDYLKNRYPLCMRCTAHVMMRAELEGMFTGMEVVGIERPR